MSPNPRVLIKPADTLALPGSATSPEGPAGTARGTRRRFGDLSDCRGATFIETAVTLPVFLFLVFGIFDFTMYISCQVAIDDAVRLAGRYGVTMAGDCVTPAVSRFSQSLTPYAAGTNPTLNAAVVPVTGGMRALRIVSTAVVQGSLPLRLRVHSMGLFPIEDPAACLKNEPTLP